MEWGGKRYIVITLNWDYKQQQVHLSMSGYIQEALKQFQYVAQKKQTQPYPSVKINYGEKKQYTTQQSSAPPLDARGNKFIQQVCGSFLFLGRAFDRTLLCPISAIASQSANLIEETVA